MTEEAQIAGQDIGGGETAEQPQLSITDLQNLRAIVDVAVRRGVFAANEISAVGAVYDRVNKFLNVVAPPQAEAAPAPQAE
jgi:hypothetical protein